MNNSEDYSWQYRLLESIKNGGVIELYDVSYIDSLQKHGKPMTVQKRLLRWIMEMNKECIAPTATDIRLRSGGVVRNDSPLNNLIKKSLVADSTDMEYLCVLGKRRPYVRLEIGPKNLLSDLDITSSTGCSSYTKKFRPENIRAKTRPRYMLAMLFDEAGPVFQNCFPGLTINYIAKSYLS